MVSERRAFSPAELDLVEDALERLETDGVPAELRDDEDRAHLAGELEAYREILRLGREAMPLEEVPTGVLDAVLEEARRAAAGAPRPTGVSWWKRWRARVFLPMLAFGGSAALILWMVRPHDGADMHARAEPSAAQAQSETLRPQSEPSAAGLLASESAPLADASRSEEKAEAFAEGELERGQGALGEPRAEQAADDDEADGRRSRILEREPDLDDRSGGGRAPGAKGSAGPAPAPEPKPKPSKRGGAGDRKTSTGASSPFEPKPSTNKSEAPKKKDVDVDPPSALDELALADARRRSGACGTARKTYELHRSAPDPKVRARALAGLGLCEMEAGRASAAQSFFNAARAADPSIGTFIDRELAPPQRAAPPQANQADAP